MQVLNAFATNDCIEIIFDSDILLAAENFIVKLLTVSHDHIGQIYDLSQFENFQKFLHQFFNI